MFDLIYIDILLSDFFRILPLLRIWLFGAK